MASETLLYEQLGITSSASPDEIRRSYRRAALQWHPDRNPDNANAAEVFKACQQAYEILSDPDLRILYDTCGLQSALRASAQKQSQEHDQEQQQEQEPQQQQQQQQWQQQQAREQRRWQQRQQRQQRQQQQQQTQHRQASTASSFSFSSSSSSSSSSPNVFRFSASWTINGDVPGGFSSMRYQSWNSGSGSSTTATTTTAARNTNWPQQSFATPFRGPSANIFDGMYDSIFDSFLPPFSHSSMFDNMEDQLRLPHYHQRWQQQSWPPL